MLMGYNNMYGNQASFQGMPYQMIGPPMGAQQMSYQGANYQQPQQQQTQQTSTIQQGLAGKIVDSEDIVKATEVPIGGYGIFPKADLSEIYIKSWNNNGTTSIITFKPVIQEESERENNHTEELNNILLQRIDSLENKIVAVLEQKNSDVTVQLLKNKNKETEVQKNGF